MSVIQMIKLACDADGCRRQASGDLWFISLVEARAAASEQGWSVEPTGTARAPLDLCPQHRSM